MKIAVSGYYGQLNYGDDLFCIASAYGAARFWPRHELTIVGPGIPDAGTNTVFSIPNGDDAERYASSGPLGRIKRAHHKLSTVRDYDILVYGGGSTLEAIRWTDARWALQRLTRRMSTQLAGMGLSVGPFRTKRDRLSVARFLGGLAFLSVRDSRSAFEVTSLGLPYRPILAADLAGVLMEHPNFGPRTSRSRPILGVNLLPIHRMKELPINLDRLFSSIRHHAAGAGASVRLIALSSHPDEDDGTSLELLHEHLSPIPCELVSRSTVSPKQLWRAISECSAFLTVRLHGAITAYLTDVPFVLYEYHRKCSDFVDDIRQADSLRWPIEDPNGPDIAALLAHSPTPSLAPSDYARRSDLNFVAAPWADR